MKQQKATTPLRAVSVRPPARMPAISLGVKLPGEDLVLGVLGFVANQRETMKPAIRDEWDQIILDDYKRWREFWNRLIEGVK